MTGAVLRFQSGSTLASYEDNFPPTPIIIEVIMIAPFNVHIE